MNDTVYRSKNGTRWRFLSEGYGGFAGFNEYVRVKDGHRLYHRVEEMVEESEWLKNRKTKS